ncbi:hypothetical protein BKA66DRAFT_569698 [Pyrenochaeta sp. MPI-SDFR-AT-0127]|nr:hypothetical protein BKA66DRAFT_569698 [Pyrenochaeta sp. MPI-SDFR-AT-0127]
MLAPSQSLPDTTKSLFGWTNTSSLSTAELGIMRGGSASPTDIVSTHNRTQAGGLQTTLIPDPRTSTSRNLTFVETTSASITSASNLITATFLPSSTETSLATLILYGPGYGSTKSLSATPSSTSTIAAAPPPPLTTSQTAGVAVGSTAGVLLAIVAAIFIARRYHARAAARRKSTGSVYPKVAYLYDPVNRGDDGDSASAFMAGGADGLPPNGHPPTVPQNSPNPSQRYSNSFMNRFSDPGNPFRDPEDPVQELHDSARDSLLTPTDAATAFAAAISGYAVAAQDLPATSRYSAPQPLYDHIIPSPTLSPFLAQHNFRHSRTRSLSRNGFDSNTSKRTINTNMSANTAGMEDVPLSPYGMQASHTLPPINELPTNDPEADSFEYDLLMPVDTQTETPDSVIVYVPPQTPRTSINPMFQSNLPVGYNTTKSRLSAVPAQSPRSPQMQLRAKASVGSNSTLSQTERFSLAYDSRNSTTYIRPSSNAVSPKNSAPTVSPVSPLPTPVHRGWDEIKRYSNGSGKLSPLVASPLPNFSPPLPSFNPPPVKKRSLIQLRRKDPVLAGTGQVVMPSTGNPLTVKIPFESKKGAEFEAPRMSLLAKLNNMGEERRAEGGSPGSLTASDSVYSNDSATQKKTAKHVDFAHTKLSR